jgi:RimJ/RimL family protein N-acetyltransferase
VKPVTLATPRLVLDQPTIDDVDLTTEYCQDPLFEKYLTVPWPYTRDDALGFFLDIVPGAWKRDTEYTWAVRAGGHFIGVIGYRPKGNDIGFWLGAPHRGNGYMTEATNAVLDWSFSRGHDDIRWECVLGNEASVSVARKVGFSYTGEGPANVPARDGSRPPAWHGVIRSTDSRTPKPGWPV